MASGIYDVPNERSSHTNPTPRGGGIGIVILTIAGTIAAGIAGTVPASMVLVIAGGGGAVAAVGWADDRRGLSRSVRLAVHLAAAGWAVFWLSEFTSFRLGFTGEIMSWVAGSASLLAIAWAISAYNFMDGIDALAGSEAVCVGAVGGALALLSGHQGVGFIALLIAASSAGFLLWNLPPARIFLGDVGSGFLGYSFAVLALYSENQGALPAVGWLVLLAPFAFDSTFTLLRRMVRRENWLMTHRASAYQRVAHRLGRHGPVTSAVVLANVVLSVLCWVGWTQPTRWPVVTAAAAGVAVFLYVLAEWYSPMTKAPA